MLKQLLIIYKFIIIFSLISLPSYADLIKPNNKIEPYQVVKIQLKSLKENDRPIKDSGIEQTWQFAHPDNQKITGPLNKFKSMIKGKDYRVLLNHLDHKVVEIKITDLIALFEVIVLDKDKAYYKFNWQVEKYTVDGPLKDCWLTTVVSTSTSLGSSI